VDTFLLVVAALFPVVNPPEVGPIFLSMTRNTSAETRRFLARRRAECVFVMAVSLPLGALVLKIYGISIPVLRVAGGRCRRGREAAERGKPRNCRRDFNESTKAGFRQSYVKFRRSLLKPDWTSVQLLFVRHAI